MCADPLSLMIVKPPGQMGFDVCVGTMQRFGVPMMNGGPNAGFMAVSEELKRKMPGRVVGISKDSNGNPALRLSLQTREQHIKRERATSNICTAQALLANMSTFYAIFYGREGLTKIANRVHILASILTEELVKLNVSVSNSHKEIFDTVVIDCEKSFKESSKKIIEEFYQHNINVRDFYDNKHIGISFNETNTPFDVKKILKVFEAYLFDKRSLKFPIVDFVNIKSPESYLCKSLQRKGEFLTQDIFNKYTSETKIMRYIYHLQKQDFSLMDGMIPLGSCTLKLNSASELIPITMPCFSNIHPFSPEWQRSGYSILIDELSNQLKAITQFDCVSLQPNSGANGEFSGLLTITRYQRSIGQSNRNIVLIPSSAHGTNPASAAICGKQVVVVESDKLGNIELNDLKAKVEKHKNNLSCIMITYPSTHGVFEEGIKEATEIVHKAGGQVYIDGANMNAQVLLTAPAVLGGDICHLNLHKTFAIPHGGGGPGVGPICAKKHLEPFLPGHFEFNCK